MDPPSWLLNLPVLSGASGAHVRQDGKTETQPLAPSEDPWYKAPGDFKLKAPGDILRIRHAPGNLPDIVGNVTAAYNILYRTTDSQDRPSWAVTTLLIPRTLYFSPKHKVALLSYQFAYNTANIDSSPSIGLYGWMSQGNRSLGIRSSTSFIDDLLAQGWIVNIPDHWGPSAAFGASVQAGHATLDSIRAVHSLEKPARTAEFITAIWGYSGGSIATGAAAELHPQYAPELQISGAVLGGLVDDISADFDNLNKSPIAGTLVAVLLGLTSQYPEARTYLENQLLPETKDDFLSASSINVADTVRRFAGTDIYRYFKGGAADLQAPILQNLYDAQTKLGYKGVPIMPMFVYKASRDQYCPVEQTDSTIHRLCGRGACIIYERNTVGEHVSEIENGKPRAMKWLWTIFREACEATESGCTIRDVTVNALE